MTTNKKYTNYNEIATYVIIDTATQNNSSQKEYLISQPVQNYWSNARHILHFVGICGAGKSTLCARMAEYYRSVDAKTITTIDYDPNTPDHERTEDRAFSRELDQLNIDADSKNPDIHRQIVQHSINTLIRWTASDANVILVDRWYESYDNLPVECVREIENAIAISDFKVHRVLLLIGGLPEKNIVHAIERRLIATKQTRPDSWWSDYPERIVEFAAEEAVYQTEYINFCKHGQFPYVRIYTDDMDWDRYVKHISFNIQRDTTTQGY